jgi:hypothetical protein
MTFEAIRKKGMMGKITKRGIYLAGLIAILFLSACSSSRRSVAIEEGWELLGESKVNFVRDKDVITVSSRSTFTGIRFRVEDRDIRLSDLKVEFDNGDKLAPVIDETIAAGQTSRFIELGREGRGIRSVEFRYRTTGNILKGRAEVLVFGRRYDAYNTRF